MRRLRLSLPRLSLATLVRIPCGPVEYLAEGGQQFGRIVEARLGDRYGECPSARSALATCKHTTIGSTNDMLLQPR